MNAQFQKNWAALKACLLDVFFYSNLVYVIYAAGFVYIDLNMNSMTKLRINSMYVWLGVLHAINAFMYLFSWESTSFLSEDLLPEYWNIIGALLYVWSATMYDSADESNYVTHQVLFTPFPMFIVINMNLFFFHREEGDL